MTKYQGQIIDRMTGETVFKSRWYPTWEAAHHAADKPAFSGCRYQIEVVDRDDN